jgi:lipid II:glycine glycyltransferase (peptidoglycan interpeptide bridge formation enzyme)
MTQILTYEQLVSAEWQELVLNSRTGTWFQSPEAYAFYASVPEAMTPFAVGIARDHALVGVCVGYVTREPHAFRQFFTRRAIINGGPCLADDATPAEAEALMRAVRNTLCTAGKPIYIETRNFEDYSAWKGAFKAAGFGYHRHLNFHIDCTEREAMTARMSEVRRRQVRKAQKNGVTIQSEDICEADVIAFYTILAQLYRTKVKTPLFPLSFFLTFYRQGMGKYLLVKYEGKVIGGIMGPVLADRSLYEWFICGLDASHKDCYPSVMATFAAMDYAAQQGIARFDVMGAGQPDVPYGVRDFKAEFGGKLVEHGRFLCICQPMLYRLGTWGVRFLKRK